MARSGQLLILNGTSSSGKSTLATGFRDRRAAVGDFWLLIGIDDFIAKLPAEWLDLGLATGPGAFSRDGLWFDVGTAGKELRVGETCRRLLHSYHHAVAAAVRAGLDVIVDDVVIDEATFADWSEVLGDLQPTWVGVRCAPEIAAARERARGDRPIGMSDAQVDTVHHFAEYAFEIDTGRCSAIESLDDLCAKLGY